MVRTSLVHALSQFYTIFLSARVRFCWCVPAGRAERCFWCTWVNSRPARSAIIRSAPRVQDQSLYTYIYILLVFNPAHVWNIWARSHGKAICVKSCDHQTRNVCAFAAHSLYTKHTKTHHLGSDNIACSRFFLTNSCFPIVASSKLKAALMRMQSFLSLLTNSLSRRHHNTNDHHYLSALAAARENYNARYFFSGALFFFSCAAERCSLLQVIKWIALEPGVCS